MTVEEFENISDTALVDAANASFVKSINAGTGDKPYLYMEAQFYMRELDRRHDTKIARRDFRMELIVIFLIGLELLAAIRWHIPDNQGRQRTGCYHGTSRCDS